MLCLGAGITRVALKAWVELVRLQTLGRQGLQQLQVDVHFLRPQLRRCAPACPVGDAFRPQFLVVACV